MGILSALGFTENKNERKARNSFDAVTDHERARTDLLDEQGVRSRQRYQSAIDDFDPRAYMKEAAGAQISDLGEQFGQAEGQRRVAANRSGFINSGGGIGALNRDFSGRLARALSGLSLQTAGLQQNKVGMQGDLYGDDRAYAEGSRDRSTDLVAGSRDAAIQSRNSRLQGTVGIVKAASRFLPF
jgi:hypothetical protein